MNAAWELLGPALEGGLADRPAILFGDRAITYGEVDELASRFGNACRAMGIARQQRVLMLVGDRPEFFHVYLGAMKIGAVPVALDPRSSAEDLRFAMDDSEGALMVVDREFLPQFREAAGKAASPPPVVVCDGRAEGLPYLGELMDEQPGELEPEPMAGDDMALWMYTSGTTGTPKAAVHLQRAIPATARFFDEVLGVGPGDRIFCSSKLFFAFSLGHCFLVSLRLGATTILYDGWPDAEAVTDVVERHRPTVMLSVPTLYRNLLRDGMAERPVFGSVRHFVCAGERLPETLFERWLEATGRPLLEGIGATETLMLFLANRPGACRPGASGTDIPGVEVRLLDEDDREIEETDTPGVLWVRGDCLASGYWKQEEKTRLAFRDGWYRTGDMFTRDADGWYRHQGRSDDMLKISGQWVSPAEIEENVLRVPGVADAAVVGVPDGDGLTRLSLFLAAREPGADRHALEAEIMRTLTAKLSIYKCPRRFFHLDDLPRTATGKVRRFLLRRMAAERMAGEA